MNSKKGIDKVDLSDNLPVITIDGVGRFNPHKRFNEGERPNHFFSDFFKEYVMCDEKFFEYSSKIRVVKRPLLGVITDEEIRMIPRFNRFLAREEILLISYFLTKNKPDYTHDYSIIIGYLKCADGISRVADISWDESKQEWDFFCHEYGKWLGKKEGCERDEILEIL